MFDKKTLTTMIPEKRKKFKTAPKWSKMIVNRTYWQPYLEAQLRLSLSEMDTAQTQ